MAPATHEDLSNSAKWLRRFDRLLQIAYKSVNDTIGPDNIVTTLLVFGEMTRSAETATDPTSINVARARAERKATKELTMLSA